MRLFLIRLKTCWEILTQKRKHWYLVSITRSELIKSLKHEEFDFDVIHHKLQIYNVLEIVRMHRNSFDDVDLLEERLRFEYKAEQYVKSKSTTK